MAAFEYQRTTGGYISVINVLDIEDYVKCVIAAEMSNDWPLEALKAQTVCAAPMPRLRRGTAAQALTSVQQQTVRPIAARHSPMSAPTRRRRRRAASISTTTASW